MVFCLPTNHFRPLKIAISIPPAVVLTSFCRSVYLVCWLLKSYHKVVVTLAF